jgi:hypothetical protein
MARKKKYGAVVLWFAHQHVDLLFYFHLAASTVMLPPALIHLYTNNSYWL